MDKKQTARRELQANSFKQQETTNDIQVGSNSIVFGRVILLIVSFFTTFLATAQDTASKKDVVDMATGMRSNGKIYVVVGVLCIILAGVFIYLINLDKKISRLEKEVK